MTTLLITTPTPLPKARISRDYALTLTATGGTGTYSSWVLNTGSAALPTGLTLNSDGTITGVPSVCGDFPVTLKVTDSGAATATKPVTLTVTTLPCGADANDRLQFEDGTGAQIVLDPIVDGVLAWLSDRTGIPFTNCAVTTVTGEVANLNGARAFVWPELWPVTSFDSAKLGDTPLTIGSYADYKLGRASVAVGPDGQTIDHTLRDRAATAVLILGYKAGMYRLPADLLEIVIGMSIIVYRQVTRLGVESSTIGQSTQKYTDMVPNNYWPIINRYRRLNYAF